MRYQYKPRKSFERNLAYLAQLDVTIIDEVRDATFILFVVQFIHDDFHDHELEGNYISYRKFHLRDTPKGQQPTEINDIVVIYKVNNQDLVLVAVNIGSHKKLFHGRYHKKR